MQMIEKIFHQSQKSRESQGTNISSKQFHNKVQILKQTYTFEVIPFFPFLGLNWASLMLRIVMDQTLATSVKIHSGSYHLIPPLFKA